MTDPSTKQTDAHHKIEVSGIADGEPATLPHRGELDWFIGFHMLKSEWPREKGRLRGQEVFCQSRGRM